MESEHYLDWALSWAISFQFICP